MATALITGASQGIGACIARRLAKDGFNIAINHFPSDSDRDKAQKVAEECRNCNENIQVDCFSADVSNYSDCETMVKSVKEKFGSIDALVNNAGITRDGLSVRMKEEDYDAVISVNQKSVFNMMKLVGAIMMKQRSGAIVSMASVVGMYGNAGQINYSASKGAVISMTKTIAKELAPRGVRANAIAPGFVRTPMTDALTEDQQKAMLNLIAMKRYAEPEEIASVVSFLVSKDASYVTGQVIEVSGGISM